jgi:predicted nucleotidyltransferase
MVALTFASTDTVKHFLQSLSPEYGLKKKASRRLQALQRFSAAFAFMKFSHRYCFMDKLLNKPYTITSGKGMNQVAAKPKKHTEYKEVTYSSEHWTLLGELREKAVRIMAALEGFRLRALVHGSIARGDVNKNSDVDVFVIEPQSSFLVETALERADVPVNARLLVQATPNYAMKAYIGVDSAMSVSFPLMRMRRVEREFYRFGGEVNLSQLLVGVRVAGVDKRLMLIEPTVKGHVESSVVGCEEVVAKRLGVSVETVLDRVHALLKRDEVGRTGVFVKRELSVDETFELALKKLADENPAVRRRMRG